MKYILLLFILISGAVNASQMNYQQIESHNELLNQLSQAAENDFPVFIYISADWCHVCGYMERDVWSRKSVSDAFNRVFLNLNIDITRLTPDKEKALDYLNVQGTPTYFFYDKNGVLKHRQSGFIPAHKMLEKIEKVK